MHSETVVKVRDPDLVYRFALGAQVFETRILNAGALGPGTAAFWTTVEINSGDCALRCSVRPAVRVAAGVSARHFLVAAG